MGVIFIQNTIVMIFSGDFKLIQCMEPTSLDLHITLRLPFSRQTPTLFLLKDSDVGDDAMTDN